jgi:hypothetical protein
LADSFHCYYDWSTIQETKSGSIKIQPDHLDVLAKAWDKLKTTSSAGQLDSTIHVSGSLESYGCGSGCASGGSTPDGYFIDPSGRLRGVMEVQSSIETPNSSLRQGVSSAINIAYSLVDHGVNPWDVVVPIVSSNGSLFQFACVTLLLPCFPIVIPISTVLDIGASPQRTLVAQYLLLIDLFLNSPLDNYRDDAAAAAATVKVERGLDLKIYHRKYLDALYSGKPLRHQSLFYLFETLNKTYSTPCHQYIVYPLCVREPSNDVDASLVFINICELGYQIGVPADQRLQQLYIEELSRVIESIHESGFVHLDLYPSNIMWKYDEQDARLSIRVIDWDSIHEIGKKYDFKTQEILSTLRRNSNMNIVEASTEWDSAHFNIFKNNLNSFISTDKENLDRTFRRLWNEWTDDRGGKG